MKDWQNITINTARSIIFAEEFEDSERLTSKRRLKKVQLKLSEKLTEHRATKMWEGVGC